jgi:hypothetical protein
MSPNRRVSLRGIARGGLLAALLVCTPAVGIVAARTPVPTSAPTPIESVQHTRISQSAEMHEYLRALAATDPQARVEVLGQSAQGRPLEALVLRAPDEPKSGRRLVVMMVGSLHGAAEPAGGEAMLQLARSLVQGDLAPLRAAMDVVLIPNANPDGRDLGRRSNANRVNLNTDFIALSQPESVALKHALIRFRPDIVLDSHEAAGYKPSTLARQNYMTDFWAQFESTNNPAMPAGAREFSYTVLLPDLIARTSARGLPAQRYISEITRIDQPITNGGLTLRNFRNTAGISGTLAFLVETRLDPRIDVFPTYRNIEKRIERQRIVLESFIHSVHAHREAIAGQVDQLRDALSAEPAMLNAHYVLDEAHPRIQIPMTRVDSRATELHTFSDHRKQSASEPADMPRRLLVTAHIEEMAAWLARQGIVFERVPAGNRYAVESRQYQWRADPEAGAQLVASAKTDLTLAEKALLIDMQQPQGRSALLLLNPNSVSSMFLDQPYRDWVQPGRDFWIFPVL